MKAPPKFFDFTCIKFCDIGPKILHDDWPFADFNEVGHLEFMKRGQQKINLRVRNHFTMAVLCVHTLAVAEQRYKHVMSHTVYF